MAGSARARVVAFELALALAASFGLACTQGAPPGPAPPPPSAQPSRLDPLAPLRAFEEARRAEVDFLALPPSDRAFGADPYDVALLPDGTIAGILRGRSELVLVDGASLAERTRIALPRSPSAIAARGADLFVTSEIEPVLAHVRDGVRLPNIPLDGVSAARDIAVGQDGVLHVVEEHDDRVLSLRPIGGGKYVRRERALPKGPLKLVSTADALYVLSLVDHTIAALPIDRDGYPGAPSARATVDGPLWGFDAVKVDGGTLIVATGVEDHPLDRTGGFFGYIDSFVYVWFHAKGSTELTRIATINASELGVVVPKAVAFAKKSPPVEAMIAGFGSAKSLRLTWRGGTRTAPEIEVVDTTPGATAIIATHDGYVMANPLIDAWVFGTRAVRPSDPEDKRSDHVKLGEALFFTDLMAPANKSDGALSRFTCETCHFEGYGDGRIHHTGRGDVRVTTKPLLGLFNNRPHFSRALDPDLSAVAENEFRVAGAHSGTDPHFSVDVAKTPWLKELGLSHAIFGQEELRKSLMAFLMEFTHRENPRAQGRKSLTRDERAGAKAFRDRCEGCHQARASADEPESRVPFERWESLVLSEAGPIVWAKDDYEKTGVMPYVHERGARVTSLRRLYKKGAYFTNGSAKDLRSVLTRARWTGAGFSHDGATEGAALDAETVRVLLAFLDLL